MIWGSERKKILKKGEQRLRDLCDTVKCTNTCIIGVPEEERKGEERIAEGIVAENLSSLMKNMSINIQDGQ